jgi:GTP-sensing pleiotropic transcriptional regulator CodY
LQQLAQVKFGVTFENIVNQSVLNTFSAQQIVNHHGKNFFSSMSPGVDKDIVQKVFERRTLPIYQNATVFRYRL